MSAERKPLTLALLLSLTIHALLLSLTFSGQGWGLPGWASLGRSGGPRRLSCAWC